MEQILMNSGEIRAVDKSAYRGQWKINLFLEQFCSRTNFNIKAEFSNHKAIFVLKN